MDSEIPSSAIIAAGEVTNKALEMFALLQKTHYISGLDISDHEVIMKVANTLEIDHEKFLLSFNSLLGKKIQQHFHASQNLLKTISGQGFPSAVLEMENGLLVPLAINQFYGEPDLWKQLIINKINTKTEANPIQLI